MQKKIIALAVAGLVSGAAFAQSNVTIYGVADVYGAYGTATGQKSATAINSGGLSGSRIGFKGEEGLGNGLKALFTVEYGVAMDQNSGLGDTTVTAGNGNSMGLGGSQTRQAFVGLTSDKLGTVVAGRLQTAGYDWACANNATGGAGFDVQTKLGTLNNANYLLQCGNNGRASNAFAYVSPTFSGFSFAYNHARVTEDRILDATNQADLGNSYANLYAANYLNGPIDVRFVFARIELNSQATPGSTTEVGINGGYDFKVVKFNASWQQSKMENFDANSKWHIQGVVPLFAAGAIIGDYGQNSIKSNATGNNSLSDNSKSFTLAYTHNLSKRTTAYAAYNRVTNSVDASLGSMSNFAMPTAGGNASVASLGVRHSF